MYLPFKSQVATRRATLGAKEGLRVTTEPKTPARECSLANPRGGRSRAEFRRFMVERLHAKNDSSSGVC